ncbi:hypothetical protein AMJ52_01620 [candidate division TA06 bacterium DG_78]|uniref:Uncharacterized protein n=1 Tax=candidate division TA06 bacterium DG_78 TaxID=1703772 RepID=A0A0S7YHF4_UNCT6|nr:MAG: hypothetical protein AMJ52_01620 [candidate division TA06 bacterium DG_78]
MEIIEYKTRSLILAVAILFLSCTQQTYDPHLLEYLKAEKDLRTRITEEQGLNDSLRVLQQHYKINKERELSKLKKNPEAWLQLIKDINIEE